MCIAPRSSRRHWSVVQAGSQTHTVTLQDTATHREGCDSSRPDSVQPEPSSPLKNLSVEVLGCGQPVGRGSPHRNTGGPATPAGPLLWEHLPISNPQPPPLGTSSLAPLLREEEHRKGVWNCSFKPGSGG